MKSLHFPLRPVLLLVVLAAGCSQATELPSETGHSAEARAKASAAQLLELGLQFASGGDSVRAEQYLAAALDSGADPNVALPPLLKLCIKASRFEAAALYAETYLKEVAAQRDLELLLGGLYATLDQADKALVHLQRVTAKYPDHPLAHLLLARLLRDQQREIERADEHFRSYLRLAPEGPYASEARESLLTRLSETERLPGVSQEDEAP
jgi:Tfp pilus assembly protein PilF